MTIVPVHALNASDLRQLGHNLPGQVRRDQREMREAVDRSLAVHGEKLSDNDGVVIEQATANKWTAA